MNQADLAVALGLKRAARTYPSKIENLQCDPKPSTLEKFAGVYGIDMDHLCALIEYMRYGKVGVIDRSVTPATALARSVVPVVVEIDQPVQPVHPTQQ